MIDVSVGTRMVVVLGRGRLDVDPAWCVMKAADRRMPILVVAMGHPTTASQQRFVAQAVDRALELRVHLDAEMVADLSGLPTQVRSEDEVTIVAAGREERRIGSALAHQTS